MRLTKSFDIYKNHDKNVYVWGTATYGELALRGLETIGVTPTAFIDSNESVTSKWGYPVITPDKYISSERNVILMAVMDALRYVYSYCEAHHFLNCYDIQSLLELEYDESILSSMAAKEKRQIEKYIAVIENLNDDKIIINHCEIVLTEKCSLRCKCCANLMQYYDEPEDIDVENLLSYLNNFLNVVDGVTNLKLIGGEPFLYKEIETIIELCVNNQKVFDININTNGTIVPAKKVIESLENKKINIYISNYGNISRKRDELFNVLSENGVNVFNVSEQGMWKDLGGINSRGYSRKQVRSIYEQCQSARCYTFYRGKLYRCPRAAHGERLEFYKGKNSEYVDFRGEINVVQKRKELINWLNDKNELVACYYCNGFVSGTPDIISGEQITVQVE